MSLLRAFIAFEIPPAARAQIETQTAQLRQTLGERLIRWTPPKNIHLTLKFLGDVSSAHLSFLKQMMTQAAQAHSAFEIQIGGLGCYPNTRAPRVLWMGVHAPSELSALQKNIDAGAARLGYEAETRAFSPHLTLGRLRPNANPVELPKIRAALNETQLGEAAIVQLDALHLFQSELTPNGSIYTKLFSAPLARKTIQ
ncbi:MAG: RNA 2',3'-cyclic phosphodiesterase [Anaerolineales bacterium]